MGNAAKKVKLTAVPKPQKSHFVESDSVWNAIFKSKPVCKLNLNGEVQNANDHCLKLLGYALDEVKGSHHRMFCDPIYSQSLEYKKMWDKFGQGEAHTSENKFTGKNGKDVWVIANYSPVADDQGKPYKVLMFLTDVTQSKVELKVRQDIMNLTSIVSEADLRGDILTVNDKFTEVSQYHREELIGKGHNTTRHPDMPKEVFKQLWSTIGRGNIFRGVVKNRKKDGTPYYVDAVIAPIMGDNGKPKKYLGVRYDITEMEIERQNMKGLLKAIDSSYAYIEFDLNGNVVTSNKLFQTTLGYQPEEMVGKHHRMFVETNYANSATYSQFWADLKAGKAQNGVFKRVTKSGAEIWIQAVYAPVTDEMGRVMKFVKIATDVTESQNSSLEFKAKMEAVSKAQAVIEFNLDGTILNANDNFLATLGYDMTEIKGKHHRMFCEEGYTSSTAYRNFWDKLKRGELDSGEYKRIGKGGKVVWINASYNPIFDANGRPYKVVKFATDVTMVKNMITSIEETAGALSGASTELTATASELENTASRTSAESQSAAAASEEVAAGVQTVATNMEEMVASIKEIARSSNESSQMAKMTLNKAKDTNTTITKLGVSSQEIGDVIKVISSIAQQTNLLALNATIEAARAGEAGKGFAVVANEVKELAKQTAKATDDITHKIGAIQKDTQNAVEAIGGISEAVEKLNGISSVIAAAVEEQTATTNEVSRVVDQSRKGVESIAATVRVVSSAANESKASAGQTFNASKDLAHLAEKLTSLVKKVH